MNASNAQPSNLLLTTIHDALLFNVVLIPFSDMIRPAHHASNVSYHRFQMLLRDHATDQDQHALAQRNTPLMVMNAFHVELVLFLLLIEDNAYHSNVPEETLVTSELHAQNVNHAQ